MSDFPDKNVTKMSASLLLSVTRGWVGVEFPEKKCYVTLEWLIKKFYEVDILP